MASTRTGLSGMAFIAAALLFCAVPAKAEPVDAAETEIRSAMKLAHEGKHGAATEIINRVLAGDPDNRRAHLCLGVVYFKTKRYDPALEEFAKVVALKKNSLLPYYFSGLIYEAKALDAADGAAAKEMKKKALAAWNEYLSFAATAAAEAPNDVRAVKREEGMERARQHIAVLKEELNK